jgi:hypothetical protein
MVSMSRGATSAQDPAGYSGTPLAKKLGAKPGQTILLVGAPHGWVVPDLPEATTLGRAGEVAVQPDEAA